MAVGHGYAPVSIMVASGQFYRPIVVVHKNFEKYLRSAQKLSKIFQVFQKLRKIFLKTTKSVKNCQKCGKNVQKTTKNVGNRSFCPHFLKELPISAANTGQVALGYRWLPTGYPANRAGYRPIGPV